MDYYEIRAMELGYYASQKRRVEYGPYSITFKRRKTGSPAYMVTLEYKGERSRIGIFEEFRDAVIFAGNLLIEINFR